MSAVSGTRRTMKELVDGTIRVQIDIDPLQRGEFLRLFPSIDMPVALAPLAAGFEHAPTAYGKPPPSHDRSAAVPSPTPKPLKPSQRAAVLCKKPAFWAWVREEMEEEVYHEDEAADWLRAYLRLESRSELDHESNELKLTLFEADVERPFAAWSLGVT